MVAVVCRDALILVVAFHSNLPSNVVAIQDFDPRNAFHSNLPSTVVAVPNFEDFLLLLLLVVVVVVGLAVGVLAVVVVVVVVVAAVVVVMLLFLLLMLVGVVVVAVVEFQISSTGSPLYSTISYVGATAANLPWPLSARFLSPVWHDAARLLVLQVPL